MLSTSLYNHRAFHDRLRQELLRASAAHDAVAVVMLDLDDFKKVNDVYGHGIGDQLLYQVADVLRGVRAGVRHRLPRRGRGVRRDPALRRRPELDRARRADR